MPQGLIPDFSLKGFKEALGEEVLGGPPHLWPGHHTPSPAESAQNDLSPAEAAMEAIRHPPPEEENPL